MVKSNFSDRMEKIRQRAKKAQATKGHINEKICPFMSNSNQQCSCTEQCKLYRPGKKGYECYFMELQSISWHMKKLFNPGE